MKQQAFFFLFLIALFTPCFLAAQSQIDVDIIGEATMDESGTAVAMSVDGSRVAIGANRNDGNGNFSGQVRIFELLGIAGSWTQVGADIDGGASGDFSGSAVALSSNGSRVAIGSPGNSDNGGDAGQVRVFELVGGSWTQLGTDINGESFSDNSGHSVSLSDDGNRVAIGAPRNAALGNQTGQVRVYEFADGNWVQLGADIDGETEGDQFGWSVSLSADGNRFAAGARLNIGMGNTSFSGHVRVFELQNGAWTQVGTDIDGDGFDAQFGWSVSLSAEGNRFAAGAYLKDVNGTDDGQVQVYELQNGAWVQLGGDINGEAVGDRSGTSVSLSDDGNRLAIGANRNNNVAGHTRLYEWKSGAWVQLGMDIDGEAPGDQSGAAVAMAGDGNIVAIGAPKNADNGTESGHVRVYTIPASTAIDPGLLAHYPWLNFPNPLAQGQWQLAAPRGELRSLRLIDLTGRQIPMEIQTYALHTQVRTSYRGWAILQIETPKGAISRKLLLE